MAQSTTATLRSNAASSARRVAVELRVAWGRDASDWPTDWASQSTDETLRLLDIGWDRKIDLATLQGQGTMPLAQMRLTLDNHDQRFSPYHEDGPLYSSLNGSTTTAGGITVRYPKLWMTPVRLRMGFVDANLGAEYVTVFTGVIDETGEAYGLNGDTVTLVCLDRGAPLLQAKTSTPIFLDLPVHTWINALVSTYGDISGGVLDRGFAVLPYAWLDEEPLWGEVQEAAQSDGGLAYFDETGVFRYRNAAWWATSADSFAPQDGVVIRFQTFSPEYSYRNVSTGVVVEYSPRAPYGEQIIWRSDKTIAVPPGGASVKARFQYATVALFDPVTPDDYLPASSGGIDMSDNVAVTLDDVAAQSATVQFTNTSSQTAFIPSMQLRGFALVGGPQEQVDVDVTTALVPENKQTISGNIYMQTQQQAELIANLAAYRMSYPRLVHKFDGVPALPWLQLGDRVAIDVPEPVTADRYGIITALSFTWQPQGAFLMSAEAVDVAGLFEYDNYHILGATQYGSGVAFL